MADRTQPAARFAGAGRHVAATTSLVVLFWAAAAVAVTAAQTRLHPVSPAGASVATVASIVLAAWSYTHFFARHAGISHALAVGIAWLVLGVTAELVLATPGGHGWCGVLASADRPLLRNIIFFVWIFSPAVFARREHED